MRAFPVNTFVANVILSRSDASGSIACKYCVILKVQSITRCPSNDGGLIFLDRAAPSLEDPSTVVVYMLG